MELPRNDQYGAPLIPPQTDHFLALADDLATAGRYREAMHQVLLAALNILGRRLGDSAPVSLTTRAPLS